MPKVMLLPVRGSAADAEVFATAFECGQLFDAHFVGLHVRPDVQREIASFAASEGGMMANIDTMLERMEGDADQRERDAALAWKQFLEQKGIAAANEPVENGMTGEWATEVGTQADWLAVHGRTVDLIVIGRGDPEWRPDLSLMETALLETGKPVMIAPSGTPSGSRPSMGGTIAIAWKDSKEAAGAVHAALPFLRAAGQVIIVTVTGEGDEDDHSARRLARMLRWHNRHVTIQAVRTDGRDPAQVLLDTVQRAGAGLLVMGGYGHTRLREAVFGGLTRAVLQAAPLPVLMTH